nr:hypothetical protein [Tanacetum cinerariifolium]
MSKLRGKDPFDDPFFTEPFNWGDGSRKEITIEELDNEGENSVPNTEVAVRKQPHHKAHGTYYVVFSSIGQRTGGDGVRLLEINEEDKTVGQALHTISRGIHEKGHTRTKKRNPDGNEDSFQILHNLNE